MSRASHRYDRDTLAARGVELAVTAVVHDEQGRVLLHRANHGEAWTLPVGRPRPGESLGAAITRELADQAGITVEIENLVGIYCEPTDTPGDGPGEQISVCLHARAVRDPTPSEQPQTRWLAHRELPSAPIADPARRRIDHALEQRPAPYIDTPATTRTRPRARWPRRRH